MPKILIDWTDENVETLKRLHAEGYTAAGIAKALGAPDGRSAVCGKMHRLKISTSRDVANRNLAQRNKERVERLHEKRRQEAEERAPRRFKTPAKHLATPKKDKRIGASPASSVAAARKRAKEAAKAIKLAPLPASPKGLVIEADTRFLKSKAWEALEGSHPKPLEELKQRGECRWPIADGPFLFCAQPSGHSTYCPVHTNLAKPRI